jgi:hypothetical protein
MDSSVQIGSNVVAYEDSTPEVIILQLRTRLHETRLFHERQEQIIHNQIETAQKALEEAYQQWKERQDALNIELDIAISRKENDIVTLKQKIARYRILSEYGSEICIKSYQLAQDTDESGDYEKLKTESENEVLVSQIAYDLIQGKLGMWPSEDIDLWFDFAKMKQITGQTLLSNFTQSLMESSNDSLSLEERKDKCGDLSDFSEEHA